MVEFVLNFLFEVILSQVDGVGDLLIVDPKRFAQKSWQIIEFVMHYRPVDEEDIEGFAEFLFGFKYFVFIPQLSHRKNFIYQLIAIVFR